MRAKFLAVPLLVGAGFLVGLSPTEIAHAQQKGKGAVKRPEPKKGTQAAQAAQPAPAAGRPSPRPSVPTFTRPQQQQPQARPQPQQPARPPMGERPGMPNPTPAARPTAPKPVNPNARPAQPNQQPAARPGFMPGFGGGGGAQRPDARPSPRPDVRPPNNSNQRPSILPSRPDAPATRPGQNLPDRPTPRPSLPAIGDRPNIDRPGGGGGGVQWPSKPDIPSRPGQGGGGVQWPIDPKRPIDPKFPIDPKRPINPDRPNRPGIIWPNRPNRPDRPDINRPDINRPTIINRPGINQDNSTHNTVINRPVNNTNVTNIRNSSNYYSNNTNVVGGGYRSPGWANSVNDWNNAWYGNYSAWNQASFPWYHGSWSGNSFANWGVGGPVTWGMSSWGLNSSAYDFGYSGFSNPFYAAPADPTVVVPQFLNYSQPVVNVVQALPESGQEPPQIPQTSAQMFDEARAEFQRANYGNALAKTEAAMKDFPDNPVMHEFRALTLFALGRYSEASAAVYSILASGPGWDWTTLQSLYPDVNTYVNQLFALEKAAAAKPDDASLQFLLAYHYTTANHPEAAKEALAKARKLVPTDPVVAQLAQSAGVPAEKVAPKEPPPAPADVQLDITGAWTAARPDGGKIGLTVKQDGGFVWSVEDKAGKKDSFDGTFSLDDNVLILERKAGGALMGRVTALADNKFQFKMLGGGDADPGLTFAK